MLGNGMHDQEKIYIDFQPGSHGNYLEFVCNKFLANVNTENDTPFNKFGASHAKKYLDNKLFEADHYTTYGISLEKKTIISIYIEHDDLLPLQCISLLRAGDYNINPEDLHIDTYHKFNNKSYRWVLDNLLSTFFNEEYLVSGYNQIADPSWPNINSIADYQQLPMHIQEECKNIHNIQIFKLSEDSPDCPKHILKEFFKIGFLYPENHGFIQGQQVKTIHRNCKFYKFPFSAFYSQQKFIESLKELALFLNITFDANNQELHKLHSEFLSRQPYKDIKQKCDKIIDNGVGLISETNIICEAYIEAMLEKKV
jgi:hypothetical protein